MLEVLAGQRRPSVELASPAAVGNCMESIIPRRPAEYCGERVCVVSVCREHISGTTRPSSPNCVHVALPMVVAWSGRLAALRYVMYFPVLWTTSYSHINGPRGGMSIPLQRVTSFRRRAQANASAARLVASCPRRRQAPRLDESIVQGVPRWSLQYTIALLARPGLCSAFVSHLFSAILSDQLSQHLLVQS